MSIYTLHNHAEHANTRKAHAFTAAAVWSSQFMVTGDAGDNRVSMIGVTATSSNAETFVAAVDNQHPTLQSNVDPTVNVLHTRYFGIDFEVQFLRTAIFFDDWTDQYPVAHATPLTHAAHVPSLLVLTMLSYFTAFSLH